MSSQSRPTRFFRLPQVLDRLGIGRSTWYAGVKSGKFPPGLKIGPNTRVYTDEELDTLMQELASQQSGSEVLAIPVALPKGEISTSDELKTSGKSDSDNRASVRKRGTQRQNVSRGGEK